MAVTWNPADQKAFVVLSNGNLTSSCSNSFTSDNNVRATLGRSSGKYCYEVYINSLADEIGIGFCNSGQNINNWVGQNNDGVISYPSANATFNQSAQTEGPGFTTGSYILCCMNTDTTNGYVWFLNGTSTPNVNYNPSTGVGGVNFNNFDSYPVVSTRNSGDIVTANFIGPFVNTVPSGYSAWETVSARPHRYCQWF